MKRVLLFLISLQIILGTSAQVKIGDNPNTISASALLELESTTKGLLLPRIDPVNVVAPEEGLLIYDMGNKCVRVYDGTNWSNCLGNPSSPGSTGDVIASSLTSSLATYNAVATGTWISITSTEYLNLIANVSDLTKSGSTDAEFNTAPAGFVWGAGTSANAGSPMPEGSYLFAFRYRTGPGPQKPAGDKVKISNSGPLVGFADVGSTLPAHNAPVAYFVLKGNTSPTVSAAFLGFYTQDANRIGFKNNGGVFYEIADSPNLPNVTANFQVQIQGLSTTTLQW